MLLNGRRQRIRCRLFFLRGFEFEEAVDLGPGTAARWRGDVRCCIRARARMICCVRGGRRRVLALRCGEIVERCGYRRNAGDAEDGIQQGAIFTAEARDFSSLLVNFDVLLGDHRVESGDDGAFEREFGFEGAGVAGCGEAAPEGMKIRRGTQENSFEGGLSGCGGSSNR